MSHPSRARARHCNFVICVSRAVRRKWRSTACRRGFFGRTPQVSAQLSLGSPPPGGLGLREGRKRGGAGKGTWVREKSCCCTSGVVLQASLQPAVSVTVQPELAMKPAFSAGSSASPGRPAGSPAGGRGRSWLSCAFPRVSRRPILRFLRGVRFWLRLRAARLAERQARAAPTSHPLFARV